MHFASLYQIVKRSVKPLWKNRGFVIFEMVAHSDHLVVSIIVQNLVEIDTVVSII